MNKTNKSFIFLSIILFINTLASIGILLFRYTYYSYDLECFIYLGQRLEQGKLIYTEDFETKLPIIQYIFYCIHQLGGIGIWNIFALATTILFGLLASNYLARFFLLNHKNLKISRTTLTLSLLAIYATFQCYLPSENTLHLHILSNNFIYLALSIFLYEIKTKKIGLLFFIGFLTTLGVTVRPNFTFIYLILLTGVFFQNEFKIKENFINIFKQFLLLGIGISLAIIINIFPYFFIQNGIEIFINGILSIASFPGGIGYLDLLKKQIEISPFFFLPFYTLIISLFSIIVLKFKRFNNLPILQYLFIISMGLIFLFLSFHKTHYWTHYVVMYNYLIPFIFILAYEIILAFKKFKFFILAIFSPLLMGPIYQTSSSLVEILTKEQSINWNINDRNINQNLFHFLQINKSKGTHFYHINSPIYHALLNEERIGDGHPAILETLLDGYYIRVINNIPLLSINKLKNPSDLFIRFNKKLIIFENTVSQQKLLHYLLVNPKIKSQKLRVKNLEEYQIYALKFKE